MVFLLIGAAIWIKFTWAFSSQTTDFQGDYLAAKNLRIGSPIYFAPSTLVVDEEIVIVGVINAHPPIDAMLFYPLSFFPFKVSFIMWNVISLFMYIILIVMMSKHFKLQRIEYLPVFSILFLWYPFISNVALGQLSILLSFLIVWGFILIINGKESKGAICLGFATLIKIFPGVLIFYFLLVRKWLAAVVMSATIIAGSILTWFVVGTEDILAFVARVTPENSMKWVAFPMNSSLAGFLLPLVSETTAEGGSIWGVPFIDLGAMGKMLAMFAPFLMLLMILVLLGKKLGTNGDSESLFVVLLLSMLLVSPLMWWHMVIVTILPFGILYRDFCLGRSIPVIPAMVSAVLLFIPTATMVRSVHLLYHPHPVPWYVTMAIKNAFYGTLILWAIFWRRFHGNFHKGGNPCLS